jgi:hypothetical protein
MYLPEVWRDPLVDTEIEAETQSNSLMAGNPDRSLLQWNPFREQ